MKENAPTPIAPERTVPRLRVVVLHAMILTAAVGLFFLVRSQGEAMAAATAGPAIERTRFEPKADVLPQVLLALATIVVLSQALGRAFAWLGQPRVIGEVVAGIVIGPSLLGRLAPEPMAFLVPGEAAPYLGVIAQIGVILYMFLVGLELNAGLLRSRAHASVAISHASIIAPFVLGVGLSLWLYPRLAPGGVRFTSFSLFMGVAMAITAFPVLARILTDRGMEKTELGVLALSCAAVDDVTAWCLLALSVGVAQADVSGALRVVLLTLGYVAAMIGLVRPLAARWLSGSKPNADSCGAGVPPLSERREELSSRTTAWVLVALLLSALVTEAIGIHSIFGAFLLGAIIPHDSVIARAFRRKLEDVVTILLLPAYFAYTGMRTQIGLVAGVDQWLALGAIILLATIGKFAGTLAAGRFTGLDWRTSASLGVLMNTRGLMELIVLNIGLDLGVISPALFAMMVLMALATTLATTPLLWLLRGRLTNQPESTMDEKNQRVQGR